MSHEIACPGCGEREELRGEPVEDGIRILCETCGAGWLRGTDPACATCGGDDLMFRPRAITQYSRGTQLSLVGWQNVPMCVRCDAEALERSTASGAPVPAHYGPAAMTRRT